jgi:7-carboxy-7-deazaguanine synthase
MRISEIFYSVQGEGELTGVPSVFIRTSGCNLRCCWCDTPYASWAPEGDEMSVSEILEETAKFPARHVVLTGGEPMIAKGIHELARGLADRGKHITIETAATVAPGGIACDLASLSPKLTNSTPAPGTIDASWITRHEDRRLQPGVINAWIKSVPYQLKFVVSEAAQIAEIEQLLGGLGTPVAPERVHLMPEGRSTEELRQKSALLLETCKSRGYRFCHRLHIELFGNQRGT